MKESEIERKVVKYCESRGLITYKFTSPSSRGVPDRIVIGADAVLFLELKQLGKKPTPLQLREIRRINTVGRGFNVAAEWADNTEAAILHIDQMFFP
jgi:hypothetical protein